jgi:glycolate dehydrogenase iron-sulfur subunit
MDRALVSECVHCGFCLPTCPTWQLWSEEMDSPRGRIQLMEARLDGTVALNATVVQHFDRCLGCMACVSSCPSGVRFDRLIELTRTRVEEEYDRPAAERVLRSALFSVLPHRRRLRAALAASPAGRALPLPGPLRPLTELAPRWRSADWPPERLTPGGEAALRVGLLAGCVQSVVFGDVNTATARVLAAHGCEVLTPRSQGCCGALSAHAGRAEEARKLTEGLSDVFDGVERLVVNASGCGSHLKDASELPTVDLAELLAGLEPRGTLHPLELTVAYQDSCHLRHAQRLPGVWKPVLGRIPGLRVVEPAEQDICCGSAGIYNIVQPEPARRLGDRKAHHVVATEPDAYASANPGCLVQVSAALRRAGRALPALHPVELVDASLRGVTPSVLLGGARR